MGGTLDSTRKCCTNATALSVVVGLRSMSNIAWGPGLQGQGTNENHHEHFPVMDLTRRKLR
jgi:hypothetical protein